VLVLAKVKVTLALSGGEVGITVNDAESVKFVLVCVSFDVVLVFVDD
jgi:hypothetical protein